MALANYFARYTVAELSAMVNRYDDALRKARSTIDSLERDLGDIRQAIADKRIDPNAPITAEQRRALFATFTDVFGHSDQPARLAFTGMVLGKDPSKVAISWSTFKPGALTYGEASKVLDALNLLNV